eukprot:2359508-Rhodomonas_salina.1
MPRVDEEARVVRRKRVGDAEMRADGGRIISGAVGVRGADVAAAAQEVRRLPPWLRLRRLRHLP